AREGADGAMHPVAKVAAGKADPAGRKTAARRLDGTGTAVQEVLSTAGDGDATAWASAEGDLRPLQVLLAQDGEVDTAWLGPEAVRVAALRHERSRAELPVEALRLSAGGPAIPTVRIADPLAG